MPDSTADRRPALLLSEVCAGYGQRAVLDNLSLTIPHGEAYALLGPNGSGKSTAARVACGLLTPLRGQVEVDGLPLSGGGVKSRIGLAPQDCALFSSLTIRENLEVMAVIGGIERSERTAAVAHALELASCVHRADERVGALSGGWRRRANLAAALVCGPSLLILDEPTEGVDARTRTMLATGVRSALKEGAGCLIISHDAAFVSGVATRVGVLIDGRLMAEGVASDLLMQTFGAAIRLTVRLPFAPSEPLRNRMAAHGLVTEGDTVTWRRIADDVEDVADSISIHVQNGGGELSISKPGLDDLLAHWTARAR